MGGASDLGVSGDIGRVGLHGESRADSRKSAKSSRKRTNGSRRRDAKCRARRARWAEHGIKVGSINMAGMSYFKTYFLLEKYNFDVLCVQETWLTGVQPELFEFPGYALLE